MDGLIFIIFSCWFFRENRR